MVTYVQANSEGIIVNRRQIYLNSRVCCICCREFSETPFTFEPTLTRVAEQEIASLINQYVFSRSGWKGSSQKAKQMAEPPRFLFSHNSAVSVKMIRHWLSTIWHPHPLPPSLDTQTPTLWPQHMHTALTCPPCEHTPAQRNSFSNFPWLRKQYTSLNNVDISNALKRSSNGALIGSKWRRDYKHTSGESLTVLPSSWPPQGKWESIWKRKF